MADFLSQTELDALLDCTTEVTEQAEQTTDWEFNLACAKAQYPANYTIEQIASELYANQSSLRRQIASLKDNVLTLTSTIAILSNKGTL